MGILRFLLALTVLAVHCFLNSIPIPGSENNSFWPMFLIWMAGQSVALFFILSPDFIWL